MHLVRFVPKQHDILGREVTILSMGLSVGVRSVLVGGSYRPVRDCDGGCPHRLFSTFGKPRHGSKVIVDGIQCIRVPEIDEPTNESW